MANLDKHKHNLVHDWLEGEEGTAPAQPRSAHLTGGAAVTPARRRPRPAAVNGQAAKPDVALVREPAPPAKSGEKHSPANSPEHLRKQQRLAKLRAPHFAQGGPK
jgi:hypothetical protein